MVTILTLCIQYGKKSMALRMAKTAEGLRVPVFRTFMACMVIGAADKN